MRLTVGNRVPARRWRAHGCCAGCPRCFATPAVAASAGLGGPDMTPAARRLHRARGGIWLLRHPGGREKPGAWAGGSTEAELRLIRRLQPGVHRLNGVDRYGTLKRL